MAFKSENPLPSSHFSAICLNKSLGWNIKEICLYQNIFTIIHHELEGIFVNMKVWTPLKQEPITVIQKQLITLVLYPLFYGLTLNSVEVALPL